MINDEGMRQSLGRMSGIDERVTGDAVKDYRLIYELRTELQKKGRTDEEHLTKAINAEKANLGLTYLLLFHPSPLVRHEAAFVLGEYGTGYNPFLRDSALLDPDPIVRHEAALAMGTPSQRRFSRQNRWVLEYIAAMDRSRMVRDTAKVSLDNIRSYTVPSK